MYTGCPASLCMGYKELHLSHCNLHCFLQQGSRATDQVTSVIGAPAVALDVNVVSFVAQIVSLSQICDSATGKINLQTCKTVGQLV